MRDIRCIRLCLARTGAILRYAFPSEDCSKVSVPIFPRSWARRSIAPCVESVRPAKVVLLKVWVSFLVRRYWSRAQVVALAKQLPAPLARRGQWSV